MMISKPLKNTRHEKFAVCLFQGMQQDTAYIEAGYAVRGARANASRLIAKDNIRRRLEALQAPIAKQAQTEKELKLGKLTEIYNYTPLPESISARDRVLAIAEHNKMIGDYAPEKHLNLNVDVRFVIGRGYVTERSDDERSVTEGTGEAKETETA